MSQPPLLFGMIVRDEAAMLSRTLPSLTYPFATKLALDTGSTDATPAMLAGAGFTVTSHAWTNDFSAARNTLLAQARQLNPEGWLLMLDADEAMFPTDLARLHKLLTITPHDAVALPRYNLANQACYYETGNFPDWQARCIRLASPATFTRNVHEVLECPQERATGCFIYHYGWCKSPRENWLRSHNYRMIAEGKPLLAEPPDWVSDDPGQWFADMHERHSFATFDQPHPLKRYYA